MKKQILLLLVILTLPLTSFAKEETQIEANPTPQEKTLIAFIYPGEDGTNEQAQAFFNELFKVLAENDGPLLEGFYISDEEEALNFLKENKAAYAIVSLPFYLKHSPQISMKVLLASDPIGANKGIENYRIIGHKSSVSPLSHVTLSGDDDPVFIKNIVLDGFKERDTTTFQEVSYFLGALKKIGLGEDLGGALVNPYQYESIKKLKLDWAKGLKKVHFKSPNLPAAPFVRLSKEKPANENLILERLLELSKKSKNKQALNGLRLEGFVATKKEYYDSLVSKYAKALEAAPSKPESSPK